MIMRRYSKPNRPVDRSAALTVEFAIVAPIIFMIFVGALEMTSMNLIRHSAGNAAYEVARAAIIPGISQADAKAKADNILNAVGATRNVEINITDDGRVVEAEIVVPVNDNSWGLGRFTQGLEIRKKCSLSREL